MKFGVRLAVQGEMGAPGAGFDYAKLMALKAEELGFDSVWLPDHVINAHMQKRTPMLECWTVLSALAVLTSKVKLAGHTFNNSLRNPAVMAKMAATLDVISGGRVIYSLGSAWFKHETSSYDLPFDEHDQRVARLRESLEIAKALWTQDEVNYQGPFHTLRDAYLEPKPVQKPHIPIWVPGDSEATRRLAADLADVWLTYSQPPEVIAEWVDDMTRRRGGRRLPMAVSTVCLAGLAQPDVDRWSVLYAKEREHRFAKPPTPQDVLNENLWGTAAQCIDRIRKYESLGVEHLIIQPIPPLEGMQYFAKEIMPAFQ
ncbi:MAG: LLM class flavin-dependent oxidoreductase [Methylibium sp.]|uniref:LLM class flavin-dependent oxidoreductase n=1 Tax=Methylibium sp. TaxID=2067992 RepID=UPI0018101247|nr:LLM class flavin-dependent oxidoreductase [Methylibium sp.]MBA3596145.1 LLM class flavin-dependent oxidoreductase [Methylibium sp.]